MATTSGLSYALRASPAYQTFEATNNIDNIIDNITANYSASLQSENYQQPAYNLENLSTVTYKASSGNCKFLPPISLDQYKLNNDANPEIIRKKPVDIIRYRQELAYRFLEPPQPPKPGDIIVKQLPNRQIAPAPPLVVRQVPPKPSTPAPLVLREAPPNPPSRIAEKLVLVPGKVLAPPARKVVVERLPTIPPKPQQIYLEKWLPFKQQKRRVIFQKADPDCIIPNPRNLIIQWENPEVEISREYRNLGTHFADPEEYIRRYGSDLLRHEEFKISATRAGAPDSLISLESHKEFGLPELEGDIEALRLVDLDKSGLSEYKHYLSSLGVTFDSAAFSSSASPYGYITTPDSNNLITINEAQSFINNLHAGNEKPISDNELRSYFSSIDTDGDGVISYEEFKAAAL